MILMTSFKSVLVLGCGRVQCFSVVRVFYLADDWVVCKTDCACITCSVRFTVLYLI